MRTDTDVMFIYAIESVRGEVKVGVSSRPRRRLSQLRTASPCVLTLINMWQHDRPYIVERVIHDLLAEYHSTGEWFTAPSTIVLDAIKQGFLLVGGELPIEQVPDRITWNGVNVENILSGVDPNIREPKALRGAILKRVKDLAPLAVTDQIADGVNLFYDAGLAHKQRAAANARAARGKGPDAFVPQPKVLKMTDAEIRQIWSDTARWPSQKDVAEQAGCSVRTLYGRFGPRRPVIEVKVKRKRKAKADV